MGLGCNVTNIRNYRFDGKNFSEDSQYEVVMAECVGWDHLASDTYLESTNLYLKKPHKPKNNKKQTAHKTPQNNKNPKHHACFCVFFRLFLYSNKRVILYICVSCQYTVKWMGIYSNWRLTLNTIHNTKKENIFVATIIYCILDKQANAKKFAIFRVSCKIKRI